MWLRKSSAPARPAMLWNVAISIRYVCCGFFETSYPKRNYRRWASWCPPRTHRCATTSRCPAPNWTCWWRPLCRAPAVRCWVPAWRAVALAAARCRWCASPPCRRSSSAWPASMLGAAAARWPASMCANRVRGRACWRPASCDELRVSYI